MAENSAISWTDHTFNGWIGCTRISPACDGCYAAGQFGMEGGRFPKRAEWGGPGKGEGTRSRTAESTWKHPRAWSRKAAKDGTRPFVFCSSLADVFDNAVSPEWRRDLFDLIRATPNLTWLLLTKRPGNIVRLFTEALSIQPGAPCAELLPTPAQAWPRNAAIGCTVVNQEEADRDVPKLLAAKAALNPAFAFLSMEPLLGPVDLTRVKYGEGVYQDALRGLVGFSPERPRVGVDWIITGGETDQRTEAGVHLARPADPAWFRSLRDQCAAAGVPFHFKQWGEWMGNSEVGWHFMDPALERAPQDAATKSWRVGKDRDPCTLDGVRHDARPKVAA